ncbi:MAG: hypothetical protein WAZ19_11260 [Anaerolineae bacterium]
MNCDNTIPPRSNIRIIGCDGGQVWHVHGDHAGEEGVTLVEGGFGELIESKIRTLERVPVRMDGAILRAVKTETLTFTIELSVHEQWRNGAFGEIDGALREAFSFELDLWYPESTLARIEWTTSDDGPRWLDVVLSSSSYELTIDPHRRGWWIWKVTLKAYDPYWTAAPVPVPLVFTEPGVKPIRISNPTGVPMHHLWSGTVAQWRLPDNSWQGRPWHRAPGGRHPDRKILYPALTTANGGLVVNYAPGELKVRDKHDTNLIATMPTPGDYPQHFLPPFTQEQTVYVEAVSVPPGGAAIKLIQPRRYRRPWGRV